MRSAWTRHGRRFCVTLTRLKEHSLRVEHVVAWRKRRASIRDNDCPSSGRLLVQPLFERRSLVISESVPKIECKVINRKCRTVATSSLLLFLNFDDSNLSKMLRGFVVEFVAQPLPLDRIRHA